MGISEIFWNASLEELKRGYKETENEYTCLFCSEKIEKGIIYPGEGVLYEAERYMRLHIEQVHGSAFDYMIGLDKKLTGLTEHQSRLLQLFYEGKSDSEIQQEMGIGSASTIRNHRFVLKEKERQAKLFLTMMELLKTRDEHAPAMVAPHQTATMIDNRYHVTEDEREGIVRKYFPQGSTGPLNSFPKKEKQRLFVIREIAQRLTSGRIYGEKEINEILEGIYHDYVLIRRYLIEYGFLDRKPDGSQYWVKT
jgi:hypothetical protein